MPTAENDADYVVEVRKPGEQEKWDRAVFDFLVKYRAKFQPPYPSQVALLPAADAGHAAAYARAITKHASAYQARVIPPE